MSDLSPVVECFKQFSINGQLLVSRSVVTKVMMGSANFSYAECEILLDSAGCDKDVVDVDSLLKFLGFELPAQNSVIGALGTNGTIGHSNSSQMPAVQTLAKSKFQANDSVVQWLSKTGDMQWLLHQDETEILKTLRALKSAQQEICQSSVEIEIQPVLVAQTAQAEDDKEYETCSIVGSSAPQLRSSYQAWSWSTNHPVQTATSLIDDNLKSVRHSLQGKRGLCLLFQWKGSIVEFDEEPESTEKVAKAFSLVTRNAAAKEVASVRSTAQDTEDRSKPLYLPKVHRHKMTFNTNRHQCFCDVCRKGPIGPVGCWTCLSCNFDYCIDCASETSKRLAVGTQVLARWRAGPWHSASIAHDHGDSTYNVEFETGIFEYRIPREQIKIREQTNTLSARVKFNNPSAWLEASQWLQGLDESCQFMAGVLEEEGAVCKRFECHSGSFGVKVKPIMLAYGGCKPGLRLSMPARDLPMAHRGTVVGLCIDGSYAVRVDNDYLSVDQPMLRRVDPRPANVYLAKACVYQPGVRLAVLHNNETLTAVVQDWTGELNGNQHRLEINGELVLKDLNEFNHFELQFETAVEYERARSDFCDYVLNRYTMVEDAITGNHLHIGEQTLFITPDTGEAASGCWAFTQQDSYELRQRVCVNGGKIGVVHNINPYDGAPNVMFDDGTLSGFVKLSKVERANAVAGVQRKAWSSIRDMCDLTRLLLEPSSTREQGAFEAQPLLMRAGPGTGKTWSLQQVFYLLACALRGQGEGSRKLPAQLEALGLDMDLIHSGVRLVPLMIPVQKLVRLLRHRDQSVSQDKSLILQYIDMEFEGSEPDMVRFRKALYHAAEIRALVVLIDGIDEAAGMKLLIEDWVLKDLVPTGMRTCVTSRPEGVNVQLYTNDFVIMNLKELTAEQQDQAIDQQLSNDKYYYHLNQFSVIRKKHDSIYYTEAFLAQSDRDRVENATAVNLFEIAPGKMNGDIRQKGPHGKTFAKLIVDPTKPMSQYLQSCTEGLEDGGYFGKLDSTLKKLLAQEQGVVTEKDLQDSLGFGDKITRDEDILVRLGLMLLKCRKPAEPELDSKSLWLRIVARTDEIYCVAEQLKEKYRLAVLKLLKIAGLHEDDLDMGPLKDPVRVFEKATDDYSKGKYNLGDGVLPETWVADIIRSRILGRDAANLIEFQDMLAQPGGKQLNIEGGEEVNLRLLRSKNKFTKPDPTRFRNILNNVEITLGPLSLVCEMQVHHIGIYNWNEASHAHDHYNFFRTQLANQYEQVLSGDLDDLEEFDDEIDKRMKVFEEICKVPVLLSMLIVCLQAKREDASVNVMPNSIFQLYDAAMCSVLRRSVKTFCAGTDACYQKATRMLERIAVYNTFAGKRVFTTSDVKNALEKDLPDELKMWNHFYSKGAPPLVKILAESIGDSEAEFQFKHLSFQEALTVRSLIAGKFYESFWSTDAQALANLNRPQFRNAIKIGGTLLGGVLAMSRDEWCFTSSIAKLTDDGWENAKLLLDGSDNKLRVLSLSGQSAASTTSDMFSKMKNLVHLRIDGTSVAGSLSALSDSSNLKVLDASFCKLVGPISDVKGLTNLEELRLGYCQVTGSVQDLADLVNLKVLDMSGTKLTGTLSQLAPLRQLEVLDLEKTSAAGTLDGLEAFSDTLRILDVRHTGIKGFVSPGVLRCLSATRQRGFDTTVLLPTLNFNLASDLSPAKDLTVIDLSYMRVGGDIGLFKVMNLLQKLFLVQTQIEGDIAQLSTCAALRLLWLSGSKGICGSVKDLQGLGQLEDMRLECCSQVRSGLDEGSSFHFPSLQRARLHGTSIVDAGGFPDGTFKPALISDVISAESSFSSSYWARKLFGPTLLTKDKDNNVVVTPTGDYIKSARIVLMYFGGSWCPHCPPFSHSLAGSLKKYLEERDMCTWEPADVVVVQISRDRDQEAFDEYFSQFPWAAVPYEDASRREHLNSEFRVQGYPALSCVDGISGSTITTDADDVFREAHQRFQTRSSPPLAWMIEMLEEMKQ